MLRTVHLCHWCSKKFERRGAARGCLRCEQAATANAAAATDPDSHHTGSWRDTIPCAGCDHRGVTDYGRYCWHCEEGADDSTELGREILAFLAVRKTIAEFKFLGREFDEVERAIADRVCTVGNVHAAESLVMDRFWRHPDGMISLGRGDMVLWTVFSPKSRQWIVFKCDRRSAKPREGIRFGWVPHEYIAATDGHVLTDVEFDWTGMFRLGEARYASRPAEFTDHMDLAWEVADAWRRQLEQAWAEAPENMWEEQLGFGGEVWAMREAQKPRTVGRWQRGGHRIDSSASWSDEA
jgi:hypothetical protein